MSPSNPGVLTARGVFAGIIVDAAEDGIPVTFAAAVGVAVPLVRTPPGVLVGTVTGGNFRPLSSIFSDLMAALLSN